MTGKMAGFKFDFENLKVYQKSLDFIDAVFKIYKNLSHEYKYSIGSNLIRAALSVSNNIAEGNDKGSNRERNRYLSISSGSTRECVSVLNILKRQNMIDTNVYLKLRNDAREITNMLQGLIKNNLKR